MDLKLWLLTGLCVLCCNAFADKLTTADMVARVASDTGLSEEQASAAVDALLSNIVAGLVNGDRVQLPGIGTLHVEHRQARTGRNPNGEQIVVPARRVVRFKASKALKDRLQEAELPPTADDT